MTATRRNFISAIFGATAVTVVGRRVSASDCPAPAATASSIHHISSAKCDPLLVSLVGVNLYGEDPVLQIAISADDPLRVFIVDVSTMQRMVSDISGGESQRGVRSFQIMVFFRGVGRADGGTVYMASTLVLNREPRVDVVAEESGIVLASSREWA